MLDNPFKKAQQFFQKDLSFSLTLCYISLIAVGMIFDMVLYSFFKINIANYSDISDFLLAPFRDLKILVFTIGTILILHWITEFDIWLEKKHPKWHKMFYYGIDKEKFQKSFSGNGMYVILFLYIFMAAYLYSLTEVKKIKNQAFSNTIVSSKDYQSAPNDTLIYIGKTNTFIFMYKKNDKSTLILPVGDVLSIEVKK